MGFITKKHKHNDENVQYTLNALYVSIWVKVSVKCMNVIQILSTHSINGMNIDMYIIKLVPSVPRNSAQYIA